MQTYHVQLMPDALQDLKDIYDYIAEHSSYPDIAYNYITTLKNACYQLQTAPLQGQKRDDLCPHLRILPVDKKTVIVFDVDQTSYTVTILNIFYGGRDCDAIMGNNL